MGSVGKAIERMREEGIGQALVRTTLLLPCVEYDLLRRDVLTGEGNMEEAGFQVSCDVRGLDEPPAIRERLVRRAKSALETIYVY